MKVHKRIIACMMVALLANVPLATANGGLWVLGVGNLTCNLWTARRAQEPSSAQVMIIVSWTQGWLTAVSEDLFTVSNGTERLQHVGADNIANWYDHYCRMHQLSTINAAVKVLESKLIAVN